MEAAEWALVQHSRIQNKHLRPWLHGGFSTGGRQSFSSVVAWTTASSMDGPLQDLSFHPGREGAQQRAHGPGV